MADILPPQIHDTLNRPIWADEFWLYVLPVESGCWEWQGAISNTYGTFHKGDTWSTRRVHRLSFMWTNGPIAYGRVIDHLCRNRLCVNPAHLESVTDRENILRGIGAPALNAEVETCKNGHPLAGDNLIPYYLARGERQCRLCARERSRVRHFKRPSDSPNAGTCAACERSIHVRDNGLMHRHRTPDKQLCPGSGQPPMGVDA